MRDPHEPIEMEGLGELSADGGLGQASEPLPETIGPYRIQRRIATGGMGSVYEAVQENPRRSVALKVMRAGIASRAALRRFEYEAQILARLRHHGIAQIYEAGTHTSGDSVVPYFAMEYVPGARDVVTYAREKELSLPQRLELLAAVCDAVHHGHQKGVIHRDLKPGNVLVDSAGQPKVIDFGVARGTDSDVRLATFETEVGQLLGTLQYMSPEQCAADPHDLDVRTDVYSLGIILYELVTGRLPYDVRSTPIYEATRIIRETAPARPRTTARHVSGDVETIALKALEKDRDRRYRSAADLGDDLRRYLRGDPISARRPSVWYQVRIAARRHRVLFGAGAAIVLSLALGVVGTTRGLLDARDAERDALAQARLAEAARTTAEAARGEAELAREAEARERERAEDALREAQRARAAEAERNRELRRESYASAVAAADGALREGDVRAAREHLTRAPADLRAWEWYVLASRLDVSRRTLYGHANKVGGVTVDPRGQRAVTIDHSSNVIVWDLYAGEELARFPVAVFTAGTSPVAFSGDGEVLFAPATPLELGAWDPQTGKPLARYAGDLRVISAVAAASAAPRAAAAAVSLCVWDTATGERLLRFGPPGVRFVSVALDPAGELVAARTMSGQLHVLEVATGEHAFPPVDERIISVGGVAFDPSGSLLAVVSSLNGVELRDPRTGAVLRSIRPVGGPYTIDFDPAGERVVLGCLDGRVEVYDVATGAQVANLLGHERFALAAFHPDGRRVVSGSWDRTVKVWDVPAPLHDVPLEAGFMCPDLCSTPDGSVVFVPGLMQPGSSASTPALWAWSPARGERVWSRDDWLRGARVLAAVPSGDGRRLFAALSDGRLGALDARTGELVRQARLSEPARALACDPASTTLAAAAGAKVELFGLDLVARGEHFAPAPLRALEFHPSGEYLAGGGVDTLCVWEVASGFPLWEIPFPGETVTDVAFPASDRLLTVRATKETTGVVELWDLAQDPPARRPVGTWEADFVLPELVTVPGGERVLLANLNPSRLPVLDRDGELVLELREPSLVSFMLASVHGSRSVANDLVGHVVPIDSERGRRTALGLDAAGEARGLVDRVLAVTLSLQDVLARVRAEPGVSEVVRAEALRIANALDPSPAAAGREVDLVVVEPGKPAAEYARVLDLARTLVRMSPGSAEQAARLGAALFRAERVPEAIAELERARTLEGSPGLGFGFLAMAYARSGRAQEARESLGLLRGAVQASAVGSSWAVHAFVGEVERALAGD